MGLQERLDALQPRERRLLGIFVGLFIVIAVLLIPIGVSAMLAEKRTLNSQLREVIDRLLSERDDIHTRQAANERVLARYRSPTPPLAGLIDRYAKELEIDIPEFKDRPPVPQGKKYEERSTDITLKKVGMRKLVLFMEKIAKAPHPISVTRLNIKKRGTETDSWDAAMTITAYHRLEQEKKKPATAEKGEDE